MDVSNLRNIYQKCIADVDTQLTLECLVDDNRVERLISGSVQVRHRIACPKGEKVLRSTDDVNL